MKTKKTMLQIVLMAVILMAATQISFSRVISINATSNNTFSPANVTNAIVGDTIKWVRTGGSHTTTCDGQQFTSRPAGAPPWNAPLNSGNPTFSYVLTVAGTYNYICEPHAPSMAGIIVVSQSAIVQNTSLAADFSLKQNFPNPFNPSTKINFSIPSASNVTLKIYDEVGREVETLVNQNLNSGVYTVDWNAINHASGIYYYSISAGEFLQTKKMLLVK